MSLINQVLKDLEQRREGPVSSADGTILTTPRYTVARGSSPFVLYVFAVVLIILSLLIGFLVWDRIIERGGPMVMTIGGRPAPAPTVTFRPSDAPPASPSSAPPAENAIVGLVKPGADDGVDNAASKKKVEHEPTAQTRSAPEKIATAKETAPAPKTVETDETETGHAGSIEKQRRPLTPQQRTDRFFQKAYSALRKGQLQQSEQFFRQALAIMPGHIKSREMLAGLYIKSGRYVEAGQLLKQGVALNPAYSLFRKLYARVLLEQDALDQAVAVLERNLPQINQDVDYYALLAALYQRQGRHENAVALYQNMLKQNSMVGIWWIGMGISLEKLGDTEAARQAYEKARASGTLAAQMIQYTDNRLAALKEIGYPDE